MSLNEQLAVDKMIQARIFELLLRWRTIEIAMVADIEKMYLQIKLDESQHHLQVLANPLRYKKNRIHAYIRTLKDVK